MTAGEDVGAWSVDQVAGWLEGLQLGAVAPAFKTNAVDGGDLLALSDSDLREELGCTALQARKIRGALAKLTGQPAPAASPPSSSSAASLGSQPAAAASHQSSAPPVAVGVPVFAPAAAAAAAAVAGPAIPAADLERYRQLSSTIEGLEKLKPAATLSDAQRAVDYLVRALAADRSALAKAEGALQEGQEKLAKLQDGFYLGKGLPKFLGGDKAEKSHEAKIDEQKGVVGRLAADRDALRQRISQNDGKLGEANKVAAAWQAKVSELSSATKDRAALLERIFSAPAWAGREPLLSLARAQADLREQAAKARGVRDTYARAEVHMKGANGKLQGALEALGQTQFMGAMQLGMDMDPFRPRMGGLMMDMMEMQMVQQANDLVRAAAQDISSAQRILPQMPTIDEALLKAATMGVFTNLLFNNMFADMAQMMMVRQSIEEVQTMARKAREMLEWIRRNLTAFETEAALHKSSSEAKAAEMRAYWQRQVDAALAAGGGGGGGKTAALI